MDIDECRSTAKGFCTSPQEWLEVSGMNLKKLKSYIAQKEFEQNQSLRTTFFTGLHRILAYTIDTVTRANGHVSNRILNDLPLQEAIENEALPLIGYLNNRAKILMLAVHDVVQGKMTQRCTEPKIVEEENGYCEEDITELVDSTQECGSTEREEETPEEDFLL